MSGPGALVAVIGQQRPDLERPSRTGLPRASRRRWRRRSASSSAAADRLPRARARRAAGRRGRPRRRRGPCVRGDDDRGGERRRLAARPSRGLLRRPPCALRASVAERRPRRRRRASRRGRPTSAASTAHVDHGPPAERREQLVRRRSRRNRLPPPPRAARTPTTVTPVASRMDGASGLSGSGRRCRGARRRLRPVRRAMISAQIETAVSSGVRAPMSSPIGRHDPRELGVGRRPPRAAARLRSACVRRRTHRAEVADIGGERGDDGGHVELGVVGEDADRVAWAERRHRPARGGGRASRRRPRRPSGTAPAWRTPRGRRTR